MHGIQYNDILGILYTHTHTHTHTHTQKPNKHGWPS